MLVVVGTYDCAIICLCTDAVTSEDIRLLPKFHYRGHSGSVRAVAAQGHWLASGGSDEVIKVYDVRKCEETGSLMQHTGSISWLVFQNGHLFSASEDGTIVVWKCSSWEPQQVFSGRRGPVHCLAVHPSGRVALSVGKDRVMRAWNLATGYTAFRQKLHEAAQLVAWSPTGDLYALAFKTCIAVHRVESGALAVSINIGKGINTFIFIRDDVIAVGSEMPAIQLFTIPSKECTLRLEGHTNRVKGLAHAPDRDLLFSASSDGSVRVWRLADPLTAAACVGVYQTDSRLNCIAVISHERESEAKGFDQSTVERNRDYGCQKDGGQHALHMSQKLMDAQKKARKQKNILYPKGSKHRLRQLRARRWGVLPFSTRRTTVSRKQKLVRKKHIQLRLRNTQTMHPISSTRQ